MASTILVPGFKGPIFCFVQETWTSTSQKDTLKHLLQEMCIIGGFETKLGDRCVGKHCRGLVE